jgi:hypothetical protein
MRWPHIHSRQGRRVKVRPPVRRLDGASGDRNLMVLLPAGAVLHLAALPGSPPALRPAVRRRDAGLLNTRYLGQVREITQQCHDLASVAEEVLEGGADAQDVVGNNADLAGWAERRQNRPQFGVQSA